MLSRQRIIKIVLPAAIFFITLMLVNTYQYYRLKSDMASAVISHINTGEMERIRFVTSMINEKLELVRQWGSNGLLSFEDIRLLNKKLFPLMEQDDLGTGLVLADSRGDEYYLTRDENAYHTRRYSMQAGKTVVAVQNWETAESLLSEEPRATTDYDPRQMSWFNTTSDGAVHWTVQDFIADKPVTCITGSVSWKLPNSVDLLVFGVTIPFTSVERLLEHDSGTPETYLFLVNAASDMLLTEKGFPASRGLHEKVKDACARLQSLEDGERPIVRIEDEHGAWLTSLRPVNEKGGTLLIGVLAREKELLANLRKEFLKFDLGDIIFGLAGGVLVFFLLKMSLSLNPAPQADDLAAPEEIIKLVHGGEGDTVEFKSTVRMNLNSMKKGKEIELAWLKAVVAFLNSKGGHLLLGVADNGEITGLEADNFENEDRCRLHIKNLINQHIGSEFANSLRIRLLTVEGRNIAHIACTSSSSPVFLKIGKNEEFYIRIGPSNSKLSPSRTINYLNSRKS